MSALRLFHNIEGYAQNVRATWVENSENECPTSVQAIARANEQVKVLTAAPFDVPRAKAARSLERVHPALPHLGFVWIRNAAVENGRGARQRLGSASTAAAKVVSCSSPRGLEAPRARTEVSTIRSDSRRPARARSCSHLFTRTRDGISWLLRSDARCVLAQSSCCPAALLWGD